MKIKLSTEYLFHSHSPLTPNHQLEPQYARLVKVNPKLENFTP